ncbi:MAG: hypothetical protein M1814_002802 [Vezdaea aestivalis]|nr:MAG: hypothetical protein M1814_002802 [Vezdaea aestivalis]
MILGGFTSLFMLVSLFVKEKLYIGEATVATICGIIFGPHAADLFDPSSWGNVDQITLETSRIVLVVQCFAVGVELPKDYMKRHWKSVVLLLVPVMTYGWLITSLFIWWMIEPLTWLESLCCAACVTATDPVLASSVVGKGKFAKRVPKHLRDLLSAESGCNDGMAFPFIYLSLYLIRYRPHADKVIFHWACLTVLYECVFGAIYGVLLGYIARHAIKWAERRQIIDRESFLVFYFTLALFCAGSGSLLGLDDLLVGFAAGVGFSNDGWFQEKTEESHVSNVIDLLLNLAYFVYFGSIIPWDLFNAVELGTAPWRLVVIAIFVIFFRRIPIMLALKPIIPDIKNWREAFFAGHFGPIGVGAIFVAILARAELEHGETTPLAELPLPGTKNYLIVEVIWPITTFLVISSILVHGSSIAVFTLGKHIHTLNITMSYTQAPEDGPAWMNRLPRIQSRSKSQNKSDFADVDSSSEKMAEVSPPGTLGPKGIPGNFLRRQRDEDTGVYNAQARKGSRWDAGMGPGGPISQSAITPQRRSDPPESSSEKIDTTPSSGSSSELREVTSPNLETYIEGNNLVIENEEGEVVDSETIADRSHEITDGKLHENADERHHHHYHDWKKRLGTWNWGGARQESDAGPSSASKAHERKRGPALAYQYGNTIIVEDENGEVVKKYELPKQEKGPNDRKTSIIQRPQLRGRMGTWLGKPAEEQLQPTEQAQPQPETEDDKQIRFTAGGRRMSKADFIGQLQRLDPKLRCEAVEESDAPRDVKQEVKRTAARDATPKLNRCSTAPISPSASAPSSTPLARQTTYTQPKDDRRPSDAIVEQEETEEDQQPIPSHTTIADDLARFRGSAAAKRRQQAAAHPPRTDDDSDDDGTERVPPPTKHSTKFLPGGETAAERRRREAAMGPLDRGEGEGAEVERRQQAGASQPNQPRLGIRFAEDPRPKGERKDKK